MPKRVQFIRHNQVEADQFVGLQGELTVDLTNKTVNVHDGITAGGTQLARADVANVPDAVPGVSPGRLSAAQAQNIATSALLTSQHESHLHGVLEKTLSDPVVPVVLSGAEVENGIIHITGSIIQDTVLEFPQIEGVWVVQHGIFASNFNISLRVQGQSTGIPILDEDDIVHVMITNTVADGWKLFRVDNEAYAKLVTLGIEHDYGNGRHAFQIGSLATRNAIVNPTKGMLFLTDSGGRQFMSAQYGAPSTPDWQDLREFPSGTRMLFCQAAPPVGWSVVGGLNDRMIRIDNNDGGGIAGSWVISGLTHAHLHGFTAPDHKHETPSTLNGAEVGIVDPAAWPHGGSGIIRTTDVEPTASGVGRETMLSGFADRSLASNTGGASTNVVLSNGSWRPAYLNSVIAEKDTT